MLSETLSYLMPGQPCKGERFSQRGLGDVGAEALGLAVATARTMKPLVAKVFSGGI